MPSLTREELYEQVWSEPMSKLAQKHGISDVGLAKKCRKLNVPIPPRGYWQKLAAGEKVKRPLLPKLRPKQEHTALLPTPVEERPENPLPPDVAEALEREQNPDNKIVVPGQLIDAHSLIKAFLAPRKTSSRSAYETPAPTLDISVSQESQNRALRIMDALIKALEQRRGN